MAYNWMITFGFKYGVWKKFYNVDGHEKEATVKYKWSFVDRYLEYKIQMFHWVQVPLDDAKNIEDDSAVVKGGGYRYCDDKKNTQMVDYHVDTCDALAAQLKDIPFCGNLSVRFPGGKPFILVGHYACIFKQYIFTGKA